MKTQVIFRKFHRDIIALFPEEQEANMTCMSYMHVGQHSLADYRYVISDSVPATPDEYRALKEELESIGCDLIVNQKG